MSAHERAAGVGLQRYSVSISRGGLMDTYAEELILLQRTTFHHLTYRRGAGRQNALWATFDTGFPLCLTASTRGFWLACGRCEGELVSAVTRGIYGSAQTLCDDCERAYPFALDRDEWSWSEARAFLEDWLLCLGVDPLRAPLTASSLWEDLVAVRLVLQGFGPHAA